MGRGTQVGLSAEVLDYSNLVGPNGGFGSLLAVLTVGSKVALENTPSRTLVVVCPAECELSHTYMNERAHPCGDEAILVLTTAQVVELFLVV
jgi:hypothetical protein